MRVVIGQAVRAVEDRQPVVAINTATYWWAMRGNGIADRRDGFGALLRDH